MSLSFTLLLVLASAVILRSESSGTHDRILLSQIRDSPSLEDQVPVFISPRNRVAQLHAQALGSLSVASCDSQGLCTVRCTCVAQKPNCDWRLCNLMLNYVGFEVLTSVNIKSTIVWDVTPSSPVEFHCRFGEAYCLRPHKQQAE
jgi:hypothetical protein